MSDIYDPKFVKAVFDRCSDRYITFSLICSFGFTERWRQQCVAAIPAPGAGGAHRAHRIEFIEDDVLASDLPDESADFVISTFGRKTFNPEQHARLAALIARVLKPGGVFSMIEASDPKGWWLRPLVERILLRGAQDFAMIGTYSTNFGSAAEIAATLRSHGLEVKFSKYFFGCATGVSGRKVGPSS
jgi:ubiquinone/menaquinone biosynthesis C-methylase UbiE